MAPHGVPPVGTALLAQGRPQGRGLTETSRPQLQTDEARKRLLRRAARGAPAAYGLAQCRRGRQARPGRLLDDLVDPAYRDLFVTPGASTSSPGFAFLLATIGEYGEEGWEDYWQRLMDNGARVVSGWSDAYEVDFTAGGGGGDRPIVLSYSSSPPFTIPEGEKRPTTSALLETCYRQVEYAGVLEGAEEPEGARAVVDWLQSREVQEALPENMYVLPADDEAELAPLWERWAPRPEETASLDPARITEMRETWIREWTDVVSG